MTQSARDVLTSCFGLDDFRPGQAEVIAHLLAGRSAAAVFPTGGGKSLCYQLPALMLPGLTLVVSPLIALMKDQIDRLQQRGIAAARLDSTLSAAESAAVVRAAREGRLKLLYVAPERFNNERFRGLVERVRVSLFAVDEAHCISEWGHNFRPDYLKLARFAARCRAERTLALTATATPQVLADICRGFSIAPACAVRTGFYRPNLTLLTTPVDAASRDELIIERLRTRPAGPAIVYVTLQRTAEAVAVRLADAGFEARAYHAGMEDEERAAVQEWFAASNHAIVVATIAFGMGIDKANIRYVYHYNLPKSLENLSQEIGRAGRDGLPATCEILVCPDDLNALENFVYGDTPSPEAVRAFVAGVLALGDEFDVSLYDLAARHDIRALVVRTLLTYVELDGYLEEGTPFYSEYRFRPLATSAEILSKFDGERREFLMKLFRCAEKARTWFSIDLNRATAATGAPRDRSVRALDYLGEQGLLELKVGAAKPVPAVEIARQCGRTCPVAGRPHAGTGTSRDRAAAAGAGVGRLAGLSGRAAGRAFWRIARPRVRSLHVVSREGPDFAAPAARYPTHRRGRLATSGRGTPSARRSAGRPAGICLLSLRAHVPQAQPGPPEFTRVIWCLGPGAIRGRIAARSGRWVTHSSEICASVSAVEILVTASKVP